MDSNKGMIGMAIGSWLVALAGGTLAGTLLWVLGENWSFLQGAFVGFLVFLIFGGIISFVMTRPLPGPGEVKLNTPAAPEKPEAPAPKAAAPVAAAAPAAVKAAEKPAPAKAPAAKSPAKQATPAKAKPAAKETDARPALMRDAPEGGQADDLKKISGVGPKLEQTLNELGIWHYEQVAKLKKKDIAWVDERLRFKGRIERDDWVGQAKALAKAKG
ncbi:hypothetical protein [Roseobacter weihaiensis]|uniref:hypothetical protein n=1 Tax=Roseobacter weihaiensis TaxID=2763262 RepID=UPI001D0B215E|nr:hypothetical protein [Roseobacter sp. H9]